MIGEIPSVSPPQENPSTDFNQPLPKEVAAYLTESSEDEKLVTSVQWLFHQMNTDTDLMGIEALATISSQKAHIESRNELS